MNRNHTNGAIGNCTTSDKLVAIYYFDSHCFHPYCRNWNKRYGVSSHCRRVGFSLRFDSSSPPSPDADLSRRRACRRWPTEREHGRRTAAGYTSGGTSRRPRSPLSLVYLLDEDDSSPRKNEIVLRSRSTTGRSVTYESVRCQYSRTAAASDRTSKRPRFLRRRRRRRRRSFRSFPRPPYCIPLLLAAKKQPTSILVRYSVLFLLACSAFSG